MSLKWLNLWHCGLNLIFSKNIWLWQISSVLLDSQIYDMLDCHAFAFFLLLLLLLLLQLQLCILTTAAAAAAATAAELLSCCCCTWVGWYTHARTHARTHAHTQSFNGLFPGLPGWAGTRMISHSGFCWSKRWWGDSGISRNICKFAPRFRQITTPAPHHWSLLRAGCPSCHPTNSLKAPNV